MSTTTDRLADLDAKHARERSRLMKHAAIEAELGGIAREFATPRQISDGTRPEEPWVAYAIDTIPEALTMLRLLPPIAGRAVDNGCLSVGPNPKARGTVRWEAPELVAVDLQHWGRGHLYRSAEIVWWATLGDLTPRVSIRVSGWPYAIQPVCDVSYGRDGDIRTSRHELRALQEWRRVKWASGSGESCHFTLYFDTRDAAITALIAWAGGKP